MGYILEFWRAQAAEVVAALPERDDRTAEAAAEIVVEIVRERGEFAGSVDHGSSGGTWFREEFLGRLVAGVIGADAVAHLLGRPIGGVPSDGYPAVGWLSRDEIAAALDGAGPPPEGTTPGDADLLETILDALRSAARSGQDLVTVYG